MLNDVKSSIRFLKLLKKIKTIIIKPHANAIDIKQFQN